MHHNRHRRLSAGLAALATGLSLTLVVAAPDGAR
jgi:hypothetical protein